MIKDLILDLDPVEFIELPQGTDVTTITDVKSGAIYRTTDGYLYFGVGNDLVPVNSSTLTEQIENLEEELTSKIDKNTEDIETLQEDAYSEDVIFDNMSCSDGLFIGPLDDSDKPYFKGFSDDFSEAIAYIPKTDIRGKVIKDINPHMRGRDNVYELHISADLYTEDNVEALANKLPNLILVVVDDPDLDAQKLTINDNRTVYIDSEIRYPSSRCCIRNVDNFLCYYERGKVKRIEKFLLDKTVKTIKFPQFQNTYVGDDGVLISKNMFPIYGRYNNVTEVIVPHLVDSNKNKFYTFEEGCFKNLVNVTNLTIDEVWTGKFVDGSDNTIPEYVQINSLFKENKSEQTSLTNLTLKADKYDAGYISGNLYEPIGLLLNNLVVNSLTINLPDDVPELTYIGENREVKYKIVDELIIDAKLYLDIEFDALTSLKKLSVKSFTGCIYCLPNLSELTIDDVTDLYYVALCEDIANASPLKLTCKGLTYNKVIPEGNNRRITHIVINDISDPSTIFYSTSEPKLEDLESLTLNFADKVDYSNPVFSLFMLKLYECKNLTAIKTNNVNALAQTKFYIETGENSFEYFPLFNLVKVTNNDTTSYVPRYLYDSTTDKLITDLVLNCPIVEKSAFEGCASLRSVVIKNATCIEARAFYNCPNLEYIDLPDTLATLKPTAFKGVSRLQTPDNKFTTNNHYVSKGSSLLPTYMATSEPDPDPQNSIYVNIAPGCKYICSNLQTNTNGTEIRTHLVLTNTSVTNICSGAFSKFTSLKNIVFNEDLKIIGKGAFPDSVTRIDVQSDCTWSTDKEKLLNLSTTEPSRNAANLKSILNDPNCDYMYRIK